MLPARILSWSVPKKSWSNPRVFHANSKHFGIADDRDVVESSEAQHPVGLRLPAFGLFPFVVAVLEASADPGGETAMRLRQSQNFSTCARVAPVAPVPL
jgi:hypothetical protein